jgi:hypothetical protein
MNLGVAPSVVTSRERTVRSLFPGSSLSLLVDGITNAIYESFQAKSDETLLILPMTSPTLAEKRRRFGILMNWAMVLRGDLKWGVQRIVGALPDILKTTLAGSKWTPPTRQCWISRERR